MVRRIVPVAATAVAIVALASVARMADAPPAGTANGEWRYYSGDNGRRKHRRSTKSTKIMSRQLKIAWRRPALSPEFAAGTCKFVL
jgi:hypothetical protein